MQNLKQAQKRNAQGNERSKTISHELEVTRQRRELLNGHRGVLVWVTGLSGSGKSTICHAVEERLHIIGCHTLVLDGDNVRYGLCSDLGFSREDRCENLRRVGEMAKLLLEAGIIVLAAFISPFEVDRQRIHDMIGEDDFIEIYCRCPLQVCEQRDVKGHYSRARKGKIEEFTGISSPYEEPLHPKLILDTAELSLNQCVEDLLSLLRNLGIVRIV